MNRSMFWTAGAVIATLACAGISPLSAGAAYAATPRSAAMQQRSQAVVARKLADGVTRARTPTARYNAILTVMRTLHVGVFTGKGKVLVRAGRPHDIYLYDFEIKGIAAALGRGQTMTAEDIAGRLSAAGVTPGGKPLTAAELARTLTAGTRAALARPRGRLSVVPLLARELGRRHRPAYDLATAAPDKLSFDALQTFLINADVAAAASRRGAASRGAFAAAGVRGATAVADVPCAGGNALREFTPFGKWLLALIKPLSDRVKKRVPWIDLIHGAALAFSVAVTNVTPTTQATHYGPAGHDADAGKPFNFRVRVAMLDDYGAIVVNCGALIGLKFPTRARSRGSR